MNINTAIITGNLTRDPELRQTASGTSVLQFSVAVNDRAKVNGEWTDRANYIDCTMFGTRADSLSKLLHKGSKVAVQGKLHWSSWEKDGQKRSKLEVIVDEFEFMSRSNGNKASTKPQDASAYQAMQQISGGAAVPVYESDIPF